MARNDVHALNPPTWDTFHGIRYFANIIKIIDLETEKVFWIIQVGPVRSGP